MTSSVNLPKASKPLWQTMVAPMVLASLGLHGLFLLVPLGQSKEGAIPPPDPEKDSVAITRSLPAAPAGNAPTLATANPALVNAVPPAPGAVPAGVKAGSLPVPPATPAPRSTRSRPPAPVANSPSPEKFTPVTSPANSLPLTNPSPPPTPARPAIDPNLGQRLLAYAANLTLPGEQISQLRRYILQRFGYGEAATQRDAYNSKLQQWEASIQQQTGIPGLRAEVDRSELSITYQQRVCLRVEPGESRIGVLINPDGSQRQEPVLLRSSGYGLLDQEAVDLVKRHSFPSTQAVKAYTVGVKNRLDYGRQPCLGR